MKNMLKDIMPAGGIQESGKGVKTLRAVTALLAALLLLPLLGGCGKPIIGSHGSSAPVSSSLSSGNASQSPVAGTSSQPLASATGSGSGKASSVSPASSPAGGSKAPSASKATGTVSGPGITYITNGLLARYDFEDLNNIGKDVSGNGHDLVIWKMGSGSVQQAANTSDSRLGKAALFDGNELLAAASPSQGGNGYTDFVDAITGSYTFTFFAKNNLTTSTSDETHRNLFCNGYWNDPTSPYLEFAFTYSQDSGWNNFAAYLNYGAQQSGLYFRKFGWQADNNSFYQNGVVDTQCYHYADVMDKSKRKVDVYIDGKFENSNSPGTTIATQSTETPFSIGGMATPSENPNIRDTLIGEIDDFRVYTRALTTYEIADIAKIKG